jgi:hypothetical protein
LTGQILLLGSDYQTDFVACVDNRRLGYWVGREFGDNGFARILLNNSGNDRVEAGRHELALVIVAPSFFGPTNYRTDRPSVVNVVDADTGAILDSRDIAGRAARTTGIQALGWILPIDANGRIGQLTEMMLTTDEVLSRHRVCLYGN